MSTTVRRRGPAKHDHHDDEDLPHANGQTAYAPPRKGGALFWLVLLGYTLAMGWWSTVKYFEVAPVNETGYNVNGTIPVFSEVEARKTVRVLTDIGLRVVGTKQEAKTKDFILDKLYEYRNASVNNLNIPVFEIDVQVADGSHRFDMMGQTVIKAYSNITNIVVRISCGDACNKNAILLNSHFDSTVVSPGASDDGVGVAIMLELTRILSQRDTPLRNAVVLLWNGAEESLNDASHAFITQHSWKDSIRAVLNLEAMGQSGKEILFQANSPEMVKAYSHVPYPHGSVVSNDIFRSGLILSDTDYRQFLEHGKDVAALDMAFYQNSYLYHTMLDVEETIQTGAIQHFGDNVHALLEYLLSEADLSNLKTDADMIFFDLFGIYFVHYTWATAFKLHYGIAVVSLVLLLLNTNRVTVGPWEASKAFLATFWSFVGAVLAPVVLGGALFLAGKPMTWFAAEWYPFALFGPASVAAMMWVQFLVNYRAPHHSVPVDGAAKKDWSFVPPTITANSSNANAERLVFGSLQLLLTILLVLTTYFHLGSSYLFSLYVGFMCLGNLIDILTTPAATQRSPKPTPHINGLAYIVALTPFGATTVLSWGGLSLFVPVAGRIGADTPVDIIVGTITGFLCFLQSYLVIPLVHRVERRTVKRWVSWLVIGTVAAVTVFVNVVKVYDVMHPKRLFVEYKENVAKNTRELLIAQADPALLPLVLKAVEEELGVPAIKRSVRETDADWASIYPFSHFLESYSFNLTHLPAPTPQPDPAPILSVHDETYDATTDVRSFTLRCQYPHHIWTVFSFHAEIVDWDLNERAYLEETVSDDAHGTENANASANSKAKRYVVRHAAGYGSETWELKLSVRGKEKIKLQVNALERDGFHELVDVNRGLEGANGGKVRIGRTWTWSDRWGSAMVLGRVEKVVPDWTSGLFVGVVVSEVEV
ncbi:hypothetical protein HDV00_012372 [Rhizophlyctis rosea]|nr:hypothetical protein HDV00_012372 [Rhizophlyctis rosea]